MAAEKFRVPRPRPEYDNVEEKHFSNLSKMRLKFERDQEVDGTSRAAIRKRIKVSKGYHAINFSGRFAEMKDKVSF